MIEDVRLPDAAVAVGGPLDGHELGDSAMDELEVVMADRSLHRYVGIAEVEVRSTGSLARIYRWSGRVEME